MYVSCFVLSVCFLGSGVVDFWLSLLLLPVLGLYCSFIDLYNFSVIFVIFVIVWFWLIFDVGFGL